MIEQKFKIGDVVCLKSGGPDMTVSEFGEMPDFTIGGKETFNGYVVCQWFAKDDIKQAHFHQDILELATSSYDLDVI